MIELILTILYGQAATLSMVQILIEDQEYEALSEDIQDIEDIIDGIMAKAEARGWVR